MAAVALSRRLRWLAPVVVAGIVAVGTVAPGLAGAADTTDSLTPRTAAELLAAVANTQVDGLSGTVVSTSKLGLPALPGSPSTGAVSLPGLLAGSTTARIWQAGTDRARIAVDAPFAEYDVVRNGQDVWTFDSASTDVTHLTLPAAAPGQEQPAVPESGATPQAAAEQVLALIDPTTEVTVGTRAMVAGRPAYELVLKPKDAGTLVDTVRIAVDGQTSLPLRVRVYGVGQADPAVEIGFTSVRFETPDASTFAFVPPPGSQVTERSLEGLKAQKAPTGTAPEATQGQRPVVLGTGWTSVVELSGVTLPASAAQTIGLLATPVAGGRVVTSALLSVLLLDDGRVLVGAVPADRLVELAATGK